jgi:hypothetical protein
VSDAAGIKNPDVLRLVGQMWKELDDKSAFEAIASADKERYDREMREFELKGGSISAAKERESAAFALPLQRVKRIAKTHPRVTTITTEGATALVDAVRMFVSRLGSDVAADTAKAGRKVARYPETRTSIRKSCLRHFLTAGDFPPP